MVRESLTLPRYERIKWQARRHPDPQHRAFLPLPASTSVMLCSLSNARAITSLYFNSCRFLHCHSVGLSAGSSLSSPFPYSGPAVLRSLHFPHRNCLHCHFFCNDLYLHVLKFYVCRPAFLGPRYLLCPGCGSQDEAVGQGGAPQPLGKQVKNSPFQGSPPDALSLHTWYGAEEFVLLKKPPGDIGGQAGWRPSARHHHCLTATSDSDAQRRQHHLSLRVCPLSCAADLSSTYLFLFILAQNWSTFCPVDRTTFCEHGLHRSWPQTAPRHSAWSLQGPHPTHHLLPTPLLPQTPHSGTRGSSCAPCLSPSTHTRRQREPPLRPPLAALPGAPRPLPSQGQCAPPEQNFSCFAWYHTIRNICVCLSSGHNPAGEWQVFSFSLLPQNSSDCLKVLLNLEIYQVLYRRVCNAEYTRHVASPASPALCIIRQLQAPPHP